MRKEIEPQKLDILLSTYNGQKYLDDQIRSVVAQSYSNWTLIIRDDSSNFS